MITGCSPSHVRELWEKKNMSIRIVIGTRPGTEGEVDGIQPRQQAIKLSEMEDTYAKYHCSLSETGRC